MSTNFAPLQPKVILAVGAHADDIDFSASATLAKWAQNGAEIHYLVITDGSKGSSDPSTSSAQLVETRQQEQQAAAAVVGAHKVHFLGYEDGQLEVTMDLKKRLVQTIREIKPDTVIALDPTVMYVSDLGLINHPDHRASGQAMIDAVYPLARDHLSFPDLYAAGLQPHKVTHLLLINPESHNYHEDISATFELKLEALRKHASQFDAHSPVWEHIATQAQDMGKVYGCQYAETFVRLDIPG
jgi:LmbE family N-acetylglucosaminyl deacetylase